MNAELGLSYISEHLDKHTLPSPQRGRPVPHRLLIVDGHVSHLHWKIVENVLFKKIHLICPPSHATHIMQLLDVGCYGVLSRAYQKHVKNWFYDNPNVSIGKPAFWEILCPARDDTFTESTIKVLGKRLVVGQSLRSKYH